MRAALPDFKILFESVPGANLMLDTNAVVIAVSEEYLQITEITRDSLLNKNIFSAVEADSCTASLLKSSFQKALATRRKHDENIDEFKFANSQKEFSACVLHKPVLSAKGDVDYIIQHITLNEQESINHQKALELSEKKYRMLVEEAVDAILIYSPVTKKYLEANRKAVDLLGYSSEELVLLNVDDLTFNHDDKPRFKELEAGQTTQREVILRRKDGSSVYVESIARKLPDGNYLAFVRDISEKKKVENNIKEAKELADKLIASLPGVFYFYDSEGRFIQWNKNFEYVTGYTAAEIQEMDPVDFFVEEDREYILQKRVEVLDIGVSDTEARLKTKSGQIIRYSFKEVLVKYEGRSCLVTNGVDVEEQRKSEEELRTSEQKYKLLFESNPLSMWMLHMPDYNTVEVNNAALVQYGYTKEEFLALDIFTLRPEEDMPRQRRNGKIFRGIYHAGVWRHMKKNGSVIYVEVITHDILYEGAPTRLVLANEITEKYLAEEKLKRSYDSIRELTAHLQEVREEERTHIAREIHDELGQLLTVLKMDVSWLNKKVGMTSAAVQDKMNELLKMIDLTVKTVRRIASELRPSLIDDLGLAAAMEWFIEDFEKRSGITKEIYVGGNMPDLPDAMKIGIFRIFQESLTNVARHSGGDKVVVRLQQADNHLILTITDNGQGFDEKKANKKTLGLLGMKERTLMMGGEYNIKGRAGEGTTVTVIIPIETSIE